MVSFAMLGMEPGACTSRRSALPLSRWRLLFSPYVVILFFPSKCPLSLGGTAALALPTVCVWGGSSLLITVRLPPLHHLMFTFLLLT